MQNQRSVFNRQPVRILVVDLSWPLDGDTSDNLRVALERLFAVTCSLSGPHRIQFFGLISLGDCPQVLFPLQHVRGNYPRLHAALRELTTVHKQQMHSGMAGNGGMVHSGLICESGVMDCIHKALSMFRKHVQCALQSAACWNQLEITMVTGRNITIVAKQVERATHDLDLDSLQKVQIVCVTSPSLDTTLTHGDLPRSGSSQGSCSSDQSSKSELGGLVDLLTVDNDLASLQGVFSSWLQDVSTDSEHLRLLLPDSQNDGIRVLQCDIHERLLNPAQLPFLGQFSLSLDSQLASVRPTLPSSSKMAAGTATGGATVPVHSLRVIRRLPGDAMCESVLYGMPLLVHPTTCWKTDWDELEANRHHFQALVHLLQDKGELLLARLETAPQSAPVCRPQYSVSPPRPSGLFVLHPSQQPCELLLKSVAASEIILPWHFTAADPPTQEHLSSMDICLSQVALESSYNPLMFHSGLCESLVGQLTSKGRPLNTPAKRRPQNSGANNREKVSSAGLGATYRSTDELCSGNKSVRHKTGRDIYGTPVESFPTKL